MTSRTMSSSSTPSIMPRVPSASAPLAELLADLDRALAQLGVTPATSEEISAGASPPRDRLRLRPHALAEGHPTRRWRQDARVLRTALTEVKDDLSRFLRLAESDEILITRHGKPAGVFDYRLEHHPEFLQRVAAARNALKDGRRIRLEDLPACHEYRTV